MGHTCHGLAVFWGMVRFLKVYTSQFSFRHSVREGRVASDGGVDRREAVVKPTGTYSRRPPPDAT